MVLKRRSRRKGWRDEDDDYAKGWRLASVYRILFFTTLSHRSAKADTLYSPDPFYEAFAAPYQNDYGSHYTPTWNRAQPVYGSYLASPPADPPTLRRPARPLGALRFVGSTLGSSTSIPRSESEDIPVAPLKAPSPLPSSIYDALLPLSPPFRLNGSPAQEAFNHHRHSIPPTYPAPVEVETSTKPPLAPAVDKPFFEFIAEWEGKPKPEELPAGPSDGDESSQIFDESHSHQVPSLDDVKDGSTVLLRLNNDIPVNNIVESPDQSTPLDVANELPESILVEEEAEVSQMELSRLEAHQPEALPTETVDTITTTSTAASSAAKVSSTSEAADEVVALGGMPAMADAEPQFPWPVVRAIPISPMLDFAHDLAPAIISSSDIDVPHNSPPILISDPDISGSDLGESIHISVDSLIVPDPMLSLTSPPPARKFALPCCHHLRSTETDSKEAMETGLGGYLAQLKSVALGGFEWCDSILGTHESGSAHEFWLSTFSLLLFIPAIVLWD